MRILLRLKGIKRARSGANERASMMREFGEWTATAVVDEHLGGRWLWRLIRYPNGRQADVFGKV